MGTRNTQRSECGSDLNAEAKYIGHSFTFEDCLFDDRVNPLFFTLIFVKCLIVFFKFHKRHLLHGKSS